MTLVVINNSPQEVIQELRCPSQTGFHLKERKQKNRLNAQAWPCFKDLHTTWKAVRRASNYNCSMCHLPCCKHCWTCAQIYSTGTIPGGFLERLKYEQKCREMCLKCALPAVSFSSSSASSLRSCSFPTGWVAGTVTPGIWGRQHGGVRARGEFRQSRRNFLS